MLQCPSRHPGQALEAGSDALAAFEARGGSAGGYVAGAMFRMDTTASPRTVDVALRLPDRAHYRMSAPTTTCARHGKQGMGFACIHVASAARPDSSTGFFWCDDDEMARPWAWCASCERVFVGSASNWDELKRAADFKLLCAACWDEVKGLLYRPSPSR